MRYGLAGLILLLVTFTIAQGDEARQGPEAWDFKHPQAVESWRKAQEPTLSPMRRLFGKTVIADKTAGTVELLAEATGVATGYEIEFLLLGPLSDRAYEGLAMTFDQPSAILQALAFLGVPRGEGPDLFKNRVISKGERFALQVRKPDEPASANRSADEWVSDSEWKDGPGFLTRGLPYVGTTASPEETDATMPAAVVAAYDEPRSLFGLPFPADKGAIYGRFRAKTPLKEGEPIVFTLKHLRTPDGKPRVLSAVLAVKPGVFEGSIDGATAQALTDAALVPWLKALTETGRDPFVRVNFAPETTVGHAKAVSGLLMLVDGEGGIRIDYPLPGQLYPRAFLPPEGWRDRTKRPYQPWEIHFTPKPDAPGAFTKALIQVEEDWSGEGIDPILTPKTYPFETWAEAEALIKRLDASDGNMRVVFFFVPADAPVSVILEAAAALYQRLPLMWVFS